MRPGAGKITEVKFAIRVIRVFDTASYLLFHTKDFKQEARRPPHLLSHTTVRAPKQGLQERRVADAGPRPEFARI